MKHLGINMRGKLSMERKQYRYLLIVFIGFLAGMTASYLKPEMRSVNYWIQTHAPTWLLIADIGIVVFCLILVVHALRTKSPKSILAIWILAFIIVGNSRDSNFRTLIVDSFLGACVLYVAVILRPFSGLRKKETQENPLKNKEHKWTIIKFFAFLGGMLLAAFEPRVPPIDRWLRMHIPIWLATADIGVVGIGLILIVHRWASIKAASLLPNSPKAISPPDLPIARASIYMLFTKSPKSILAIWILAFAILNPSSMILMDTDGVAVDIFLGACALYAAIVIISQPFLNSRKKEAFPEIKGTYYAREKETWTDEFEHLKVKEELEYELSQEFPDFWSASSHFTKRKKLELLERAAAKFHEKYGCGKMALIVKELKERIESA